MKKRPQLQEWGTFPDWIKPYVEASQVPHSDTQIKYDLSIENGSGGLVKAYNDNYKTVLSTSWWNPIPWAESKYYNVNQYDKVLVEERAESWD